MWHKTLHDTTPGVVPRTLTEAREREFFIWKSSIFVLKCCFFGLGTLSGWSRVVFRKSSNFQIFVKIFTFLWHISCPERVFPWSNRAHIKQAPSSNIVLRYCLRISWSVKYFCQKYWVKGSKSRTSAGTPESAEGRSRSEGEGECFAPPSTWFPSKEPRGRRDRPLKAQNFSESIHS